jgi:thermostable 8-oxoguanine DNA glycosylase
MSINTAPATAVLQAITRRPTLVSSYAAYWRKLVPRTLTEIMDRWVFAITSIQNTWQNNCTAYRFIRALGYPLSRFSRRQLVRRLQRSTCGLYERRADSLLAVDRALWNCPEEWQLQPRETLSAFRTRLCKMVLGVGIAKVSFVIEMLHPLSCEVICCDRHVLRLYGLSDGAKADQHTYVEVEAHWIEFCRARGLPAPLARHIMWDQKRGQWSTRYWSGVLEDPARAARGVYDVPDLSHRKPIIV